MSYYISKTVGVPFDQAIQKTTEALKSEGFGVLADLDIQATLKEKLGVEFRKYRILGACNPNYAYQALSAEEQIGLMLPCNVVVQENENGEVVVSAVDPVAAMQAVANEGLHEVAANVRDLLKKVIEKL